MIRKFVLFTLLAVAWAVVPASVVRAENTVTSLPRSIEVLGRTVTLRHAAKCPEQPTSVKELAKYLKQYDVTLEKDFLHTGWKHSPVRTDPEAGDDRERPTWVLNKNWAQRELNDVIREGFSGRYVLGEERDPIRWMDFTGDGVCDFAAFQSLVGGKTAVGRYFLFRGLKTMGYQLVMSQANDGTGAYGQAFIPLDVSGERFPIIINASDLVAPVFQWNASINGFNVCPQKPHGPSGFKSYVKTAIAPKDSFLDKLCALNFLDRRKIAKFAERGLEH